MYKDIPVVIVAAMSSEKRAIGCKNELLWHIPEDMKRFRYLTLGHPVIMGRNSDYPPDYDNYILFSFTVNSKGMLEKEVINQNS